MFEMRRALASAGAAALLALALSGCTASGDEAAIREVIGAELAPVARLDEGFAQAVAAAMEDELDAYGVAPEDFVEAYFEGFDYEVGAIEVDGDAATAEVTMTCKTAGAYVVALQEASLEAAGSESFAGAGPEELAEAAGRIMLETLESVEPAETTVSVSLEKKAGEWAVSESSASAITRTLMGTGSGE